MTLKKEKKTTTNFLDAIEFYCIHELLSGKRPRVPFVNNLEISKTSKVETSIDIRFAFLYMGEKRIETCTHDL